MIKIIIIIIIIYVLFDSLFDYKLLNKRFESYSPKKIDNNISNIWSKIDNNTNSEYPIIYYIKYNISNKILNEWKKIVPNILYSQCTNELIIPSKDEQSALGLIYLIILNDTGEVSLDYILANHLIENTINDINTNIINYISCNKEKGILINRNNKEKIEPPKEVEQIEVKIPVLESLKQESITPSYNISQHQDNESLSHQSQNSSSLQSDISRKSQKLQRNSTSIDESNLISQIIPQQGRLNKSTSQNNFDSSNEIYHSNNDDADTNISDINGYDVTNSEYTFL